MSATSRIPDPNRTDGALLPYEPPTITERDLLADAVALAEARDLLARLLTSTAAELAPGLAADVRAWFERSRPNSPVAAGAGQCPHGRPPHECNACDVASDLAYDAARERGR